MSVPDWNKSVKSEAKEENDIERLAGELAEKVLNENPQIRGIHSKHSLKTILAWEAQKQLEPLWGI